MLRPIIPARRHALARSLAAAAVLVVGLAGCNGNDGANGNDGGNGDNDADAAARATVTIVEFAFDPAVLTVSAGTEVRFSNADNVSHTATADDGSFDAQLGASAEQSVTFDTPGGFPYHCSIHPAMTAEIVVE